MSLDEYRRKRRRERTPEPFGGAGTASGGPRFVVQRHDARRLHYDFRLERDGALASWAVPKGVPLRRGERHLAVHVEDHPLDYADFEGTIPAGQYGAGTVEIWDRGTYELLEEKRNGGLTVRLHGERLDGTWTLVPASLDGDPKNWLLLRKDEGSSRASRYWPMLATSSQSLPAGEGWVFEPKWDGFRAIVTVSGGEATFTSRRRERPHRAVRRGRAGSAPRARVLRGGARRRAVRARRRWRVALLVAPGGCRSTVLVLFDLLELDSQSLVDEPLAERRKKLEALVRSDGVVLVSPQFDDGDALLAAAREQQLEGVVAKRIDSRYQPGRRSSDWHKLKLRQTQEVVVAGYTRGQGRRSGGFGALVAGVQEAGGLRWAGNVGTGFSDDEIERLLALLKPLQRPDSPFAETPKMPRIRKGDVVWVEPKLVAEVEFAEWTHEGRLRAPSYLRLRDDKAPQEVRREREPLPAVLKRGKRELRLSNLDKPFWPEEGITKGDLISYYRDVAEVLVPHLRGRPFTMKRYPDGWQGKNFFQKQSPSHMPAWIRARAVSRLDARGREEGHRLRGRGRRARAPVDGEHGLHRPPHLGLARRQAGAARLGDVRPRPGRGRRLSRGRRGRTAGQGDARPARPGELSEDLRFARDPRARPDRAAALVLAGARVRGHRRRRAGSRAPRARHDGVDEAEAARRPRRREPERPREDERVRLLGTPAGRRARLDSAALGGGRAGARPRGFTMDVVLDRVARDGDLYEGVLAGKQSLTKALEALR